MKTRVASLLALAAVVACKKPPPETPKLTPEQQMMAAADFLAECMGSQGADCLSGVQAAEAWSALGDLALVENVPAAMLAKQLFLAADEHQRGLLARRRMIAEADRAVSLTRDLSCRAVGVHQVATAFQARRAALERRLRDHAL